MKKILSFLILFVTISAPFVMLPSCSDNEDDVDYNYDLPPTTEKVSAIERDGVIMTYALLNSQGDTTMTFREGENIFFDLTIENTTDEHIHIPGGPRTLGYNTFRVFTTSGKDCGTSWSYVEDWTMRAALLCAQTTYHYQCPWYNDSNIKPIGPFVLKASHKKLTKGTYFTEAYCYLSNGTTLYCKLWFKIE